ncbi:DoxX-like family protein [Chitinophagaceae bacterium IBVUCB1]|nr:DoxX-like family protein [Chitinophagaceae bacterium IBVUCB1]
MKKLNIAYWIVTILFAGFMIFSSIGNVMSDAQSVEMIHTQMGFPKYIIPFLGVAKILAAITILIPKLDRIKEWAYAGLVFDLVGATYSFIALGNPASGWAMMFLFIGFAFLSYYLHRRRQQYTNA